MALLKNFQYPNGTETNYHKIGEIRIIPAADRIDYIEEIVEVENTIPEEETTTEKTTETGTVEETEMNGGEILPIEETGEKVEEENQTTTTVLVPIVVKQVTLMVQILSYVSQVIRVDNAKNHLSSQLHYFTISMDDLVRTDIMALGYNLIKTLPEFADATDI